MSAASDRVTGALHTRGLRLKPKPNGKGWMAQCPAHGDAQASLSITLGADAASSCTATRAARSTT